MPCPIMARNAGIDRKTIKTQQGFGGARRSPAVYESNVMRVEIPAVCLYSGVEDRGIEQAGGVEVISRIVARKAARGDIRQFAWETM